MNRIRAAFKAFGRGAYFLFCISISSNILQFGWGQARAPAEVTRALPAGFEGTDWSAHIQFSRDGRFLYLSNRGHDSIAIFPVDPQSGRLGEARWYPCGGQWPRHFALSPDGRYLIVANQYSNDIIVWMVSKDYTLVSTSELQMK